ncbi:MAG: hypothetical protein ACFFC6_07135, partial [Promethearchaeota archaeon]
MATPFISDLITRLKAKLKLGRPTKILEQVEQLIKEYKLEEAMNKLQLFENQRDLTEYERFKSQILKCDILNEKRDYENGLKLSKQILKEKEWLGF